MNITFKELRNLKHSLPTGSVSRIAKELQMEEQAVRNYFGAKKYNSDNQIMGKHIHPGPDGGFVELQDTRILDAAREILKSQPVNA